MILILKVFGVNMANFIDTLNYIGTLDEQEDRRTGYETAKTVSTQLRLEANERAEQTSDIQATNEVIKRLNTMHTTAIAEMGVDVSKGGAWTLTPGIGSSNEEIKTVSSSYQDAIDYEREQYPDNPRIMQTLDLMESQLENIGPALQSRNDWDDGIAFTASEIQKVDYQNIDAIKAILDNLYVVADTAIQNQVISPSDKQFTAVRDNYEGRMYIAEVLNNYKDVPVIDEQTGEQLLKDGKPVTRNMLHDPKWVADNPHTTEVLRTIDDLMAVDNEKQAYIYAANLPATIKDDRDARRVRDSAQKDAHQDLLKGIEEQLIKEDRAGILALSNALQTHLAAPGKGNTVGIFEGQLAEMAAIFDGTTEGAYNPGIHGPKMKEAFQNLMNRVDEMEKESTLFFGGSAADVFEDMPEGYAEDMPLKLDTKARILAGDVYWNDAGNKLLWTVTGSKWEGRDEDNITYIDYSGGHGPEPMLTRLPKWATIDSKLALQKTALLDWGVGQLGWGAADEPGLDDTQEESVRRAMQLAARLYLDSQEKVRANQMSPFTTYEGLTVASMTEELDHAIKKSKEDGIDDAEMDNVAKILEYLRSEGSAKQALDTLLENGTIGKGDWWILKDGSIGLTHVERDRLISFANLRIDKVGEGRVGNTNKKNFDERFLDIIYLLYGKGEEGGITL